MAGQLPWIWVQRHIAGATRLGLKAEDILAEALIDETDTGECTVSLAQWSLLCMSTTKLLEDAAHGLAASPISPIYAPLGLRLALGSATLGASINALAAFYQSVSSAVHIKLSSQGEYATISIHAKGGDGNCRLQLEDTYLVWIFRHCLYYLDGDFTVTGVTTVDRCHFNLGKLHFGVPARVTPGSATSFSFPKAYLAKRSFVRAGDNVYWESEKLWLDFMEGETGRPASSRNGGGPISLTHMAKSAGVSISTMGRRFDRASGGYREMRKAAILTAAYDLLRSPNCSVEYIADELGYHDARAFRRFFRNATGITPQQMRQRLVSAPKSKETIVRQKLKTQGAAMAA